MPKEQRKIDIIPMVPARQRGAQAVELLMLACTVLAGTSATGLALVARALGGW